MLIFEEMSIYANGYQSDAKQLPYQNSVRLQTIFAVFLILD